MWEVVDLFSGGGGMSFGFHAHPDFVLTGAVDGQFAKPSSARGSLRCNSTYRLNMGIDPLDVDLASCEGRDLARQFGHPTVLVACPPCTGYSRTNPDNHVRDDARNSLVARVGAFVKAMKPEILVMENARELVTGRFSRHLTALQDTLESARYRVAAEVHFLNRFGLPQKRERALVIAVKRGHTLRTLADLWGRAAVRVRATHVRHVLERMPPIAAGAANPADPVHVSPGFNDELSVRRLRAIPRDGGSWRDLLDIPGGRDLMTDGMRRIADAGRLGSHPDVYGRMWWDRPSITIKRECGHIGNGRYAHPEQDRLCSAREMALLQGFPADYRFSSESGLANIYRQIGDAVPPLISHQIAWLCRWILTNEKPDPGATILPGTNLAVADIERRTGALATASSR
ncbi:MAG: DNA cytosine methyltransferase [Planctomycetota bacterium]